MNIIYRRIITHLKPQPITRRFNNKTTFNGIKFSTMFIIGSATSIVAFAPFENSENNFVLLLGGVIRFLRYYEKLNKSINALERFADL